MYRRRNDEPTGLNVAALPDLIFTVLFFFMLVTTMRTVERQIECDVPRGSELTDPGRRAHLIYVYARARDIDGGRRNIQVGDRLCNADEVSGEVTRLCRAMSDDDARRATVVIYADQHTDMGTVTDIKQSLRQAGTLNIVYAAVPRERDNH